MTAPLTTDELAQGTWLGRVWDPVAGGPCVVTIRDQNVLDITAKGTATVSAILERDQPAAHVQQAEGRSLGTFDEISANQVGDRALPTCSPPVTYRS